jgi:uncharacterized protein YbbK (DUF523 family)
MIILISACLLGVNCRYNAEHITINQLEELMGLHTLIPVCPEIFGGLPTPREPSEIRGGRVYTKSGSDVTENFERGADEVLRLGRLYQCEYAIFKERSPSCGYGAIYDGSFSGRLVEGNGVSADRLARAGITILGESRISELLDSPSERVKYD